MIPAAWRSRKDKLNHRGTQARSRTQSSSLRHDCHPEERSDEGSRVRDRVGFRRSLVAPLLGMTKGWRAVVGVVGLFVATGAALAGDWPTWGGGPSKNMVSTEKGLPTSAEAGKP